MKRGILVIFNSMDESVGHGVKISQAPTDKYTVG